MNCLCLVFLLLCVLVGCVLMFLFVVLSFYFVLYDELFISYEVFLVEIEEEVFYLSLEVKVFVDCVIIIFGGSVYYKSVKKLVLVIFDYLEMGLLYCNNVNFIVDIIFNNCVVNCLFFFIMIYVMV